MDYLVFLDAQAGELEKILSGTKTMVLREFDPDRQVGRAVGQGDSLYFLRDKDSCAVRVRAAVLRVLSLTTRANPDLSHTLKELQPRLQLTEDQYNYWSTRHHVLLVEFEPAEKIGVIQVTPHRIRDRSDWIAFEDLSLMR